MLVHGVIRNFKVTSTFLAHFLGQLRWSLKYFVLFGFILGFILW